MKPDVAIDLALVARQPESHAVIPFRAVHAGFEEEDRFPTVFDRWKIEVKPSTIRQPGGVDHQLMNERAGPDVPLPEPLSIGQHAV